MHGKICVVTGANSGIGRAAAEELARRGATVVLVCRSVRRGRRALASIVRRTGNDAVHLLTCDLASQASIHRFADEYTARWSRLDVLVNNAGLMCRRRTLTVDGIETVFAVNHLGPFLITHLLWKPLAASAPSRVVNVASSAHTRGRLDFDNLQGEVHFSGPSAYARSKLANVVFTYELARRIEGTGVTANCLHPGVIRTGLLRGHSRPLHLLFQLAGPLFKGPDRGAETVVHLATSPDVAGVSGRYFVKCQPADTTPASHDPAAARRLWELSEKLTGVRSDETLARQRS